MNANENNCKCIYTLNNSGFIGYSVIKKVAKMSDEDIYCMISDEFELLIKRLEMKKISYEDLKGALIPNQDKDKFETC